MTVDEQTTRHVRGGDLMFCPAASLKVILDPSRTLGDLPHPQSRPWTRLHPTSPAHLAAGHSGRLPLSCYHLKSPTESSEAARQAPLCFLCMRHLEPIVRWPLGASCSEVKQRPPRLHCENGFPARVLNFCVSVGTPI